MDVREAILANWPYKAAAVTLSVLLWFNVSADQQRQDQPVSTRLEFEVSDTAWSLREAPAEVTTFFQGRRGDLIALFNEPLIRKAIDRVTGPEMEVDLAPADVTYDRSLNVRATEIRPSRVRIRLERRVTRRVPLAVETRGLRVADGFVIVDVVAEHDSVTVQGPASVVGTIPRLRTRPVATDSRLRRSVTRQVPVAVPADFAGVEVEPQQVIVTVEVDSIAQRSFLVPVEVEGSASAGMTPDPERLRVTVRGAWQAVRALDGEDVHATVRVEGAFEGERSLPVSVRLPPDLTATATADPARVSVSRGVTP